MFCTPYFTFKLTEIRQVDIVRLNVSNQRYNNFVTYVYRCHRRNPAFVKTNDVIGFVLRIGK